LLLYSRVCYCLSAECEARRLQKEREREEALLQRLRHSSDHSQRQQSNHSPRTQYPSSSSSSSLSPPAHQASPVHSPAVNHDVTPASSPARAPTLKQAAGKAYNIFSHTLAVTVLGWRRGVVINALVFTRDSIYFKQEGPAVADKPTRCLKTVSRVTQGLRK